MKTFVRRSPVANPDPEVSFELPTPPNRSRVAPLVTGGLLMILGALTFLYLAGGDPSRPVVMIGRDVVRGQVITTDDLVRADIASDAAIGVVPWEEANTVLVGQVATADLPARTLPSRASVTNEPLVPQGARAVGVVLTAGAVPTDDLGIGDVVDVISVDDEQRAVIADAVPIQRIVATEGRYFVTLIVDEGDSVMVSSAAAIDAIRLAKVPG